MNFISCIGRYRFFFISGIVNSVKFLFWVSVYSIFWVMLAVNISTIFFLFQYITWKKPAGNSSHRQTLQSFIINSKRRRRSDQTISSSISDNSRTCVMVWKYKCYLKYVNIICSLSSIEAWLLASYFHSIKVAQKCHKECGKNWEMREWSILKDQDIKNYWRKLHRDNFANIKWKCITSSMSRFVIVLWDSFTFHIHVRLHVNPLYAHVTRFVINVTCLPLCLYYC